MAILGLASRILPRTEQLPIGTARFGAVSEGNTTSCSSDKHLAYRQSATGVVVQIAAGTLSDSPLLNGRRWQAITFMQAGTFIGVVIIAAWNVPEGARFFAYYISYVCAGVP